MKWCTVGLLLIAGASTAGAPPPADDQQRFSRLSFWDDGLCEISYYEATDTIYGKKRHYVRVHLLNRQWMGPDSGVKAPPDAPQAIPVFKLNISEEIPTENYNYRYLTTVFLRRHALKPFKLAASSQEWCGTTFKHLRWREEGLEIQSFSYFGGEADQSWTLPLRTVPYEGLFVLARACVAADAPRRIELLVPMRGTHQVAPVVTSATLTPTGTTRPVRVPAGTFDARPVELAGAGVSGSFEVEAAAPYRLLAFAAAGVEARLRHVERRPYWVRSSASTFHRPNEAP